MNNISLIGRLVRDPETRTNLNGTKITNFTLAVANGKDKTDFFYCNAYKEVGENLVKYNKKGNEIGVIGRMSSYKKGTDSDGREITNWLVNVVGITFISKAKNDGQDLEANTENVIVQPQGNVNAEFDKAISNVDDDSILWDE